MRCLRAAGLSHLQIWNTSPRTETKARIANAVQCHSLLSVNDCQCLKGHEHKIYKIYKIYVGVENSEEEKTKMRTYKGTLKCFFKIFQEAVDHPSSFSLV